MKSHGWEGLKYFPFQGLYKGKFQDDNYGMDTDSTQSRPEPEDTKQHETGLWKKNLKELMSLIGLTMSGGFFSSARVWRRIRHGHKEK